MQRKKSKNNPILYIIQILLFCLPFAISWLSYKLHWRITMLLDRYMDFIFPGICLSCAVLGFGKLFFINKKQKQQKLVSLLSKPIFYVSILYLLTCIWSILFILSDFNCEILAITGYLLIASIILIYISLSISRILHISCVSLMICALLPLLAGWLIIKKYDALFLAITLAYTFIKVTLTVDIPDFPQIYGLYDKYIHIALPILDFVYLGSLGTNLFYDIFNIEKYIERINFVKPLPIFYQEGFIASVVIMLQATIFILIIKKIILSANIGKIHELFSNCQIKTNSFNEGDSNGKHN